MTHLRHKSLASLLPSILQCLKTMQTVFTLAQAVWRLIAMRTLCSFCACHLRPSLNLCIVNYADWMNQSCVGSEELKSAIETNSINLKCSCCRTDMPTPLLVRSCSEQSSVLKACLWQLDTCTWKLGSVAGELVFHVFPTRVPGRGR